MNRALIAALVGFCIAGATALAQEAPPPRQIIWDERPEVGGVRRYYPSGAVSRGEHGLALVCCTVNDRRRLDCDIAYEWPDHSDFGEATVRLMSEFRMSQDSYESLRASGNLRMKRTMRWTIPGVRQAGYDAAAADFSELVRTYSCDLPPAPAS